MVSNIGLKINEKNVLVNGIIIGFHPIEKKINWSSTNAGFGHLLFLCDFLIKNNQIKTNQFKIEGFGFQSCLSDMDTGKHFELNGPVTYKQEVSFLLE